jgi:hypothetical protein
VRCWVLPEALRYGHCCPGGCGAESGAGAGRWRTRKMGRALRAEEVWLGVWVGVWGGVKEVGAAGEGVV